jgi:hypothetical protein
MNIPLKNESDSDDEDHNSVIRNSYSSKYPPNYQPPRYVSIQDDDDAVSGSLKSII